MIKRQPTAVGAEQPMNAEALEAGVSPALLADRHDLVSPFAADGGGSGSDVNYEANSGVDIRRHKRANTNKIKQVLRGGGVDSGAETDASLTSSLDNMSLVSSCEDSSASEHQAAAPRTPPVNDDREFMAAKRRLRNNMKHLFVLSYAGKPIYCRHGAEEDYLSLYGLMTALVSFVDVEKDTLQSVRTSDRLVVFLCKKPLLFAGVTGLGDSVSQLGKQLVYMYNQIVSILTAKTIKKCFDRRENYDLRSLLDDSGRKYLHGMCDFMDNNPSVLLGAVQCVPLPGSVRDLIGQTLVVDVKGLVFNVLIAKSQLIQFSRMKSCVLQPSDMHILFNLVENSKNFRENDHWLPLCLPGFDESGYLYAMVSYLDENICLLMITAAYDGFPTLQGVKASIVQKLRKSKCLDAITRGLMKRDYSVMSTGLYDLRHFVYKQRQFCQYTCPAFSAPYEHIEDQNNLFTLYKTVHHRLHYSPRPTKLIYQATDSEIVLGWLTSVFEVYCCFTPLVSNDEVINKVNTLLRWIRKEEEKLFLVNAYTF